MTPLQSSRISGDNLRSFVIIVVIVIVIIVVIMDDDDYDEGTCRAAGFPVITSAACLKALLALCSPSAAITLRIELIIFH